MDSIAADDLHTGHMLMLMLRNDSEALLRRACLSACLPACLPPCLSARQGPKCSSLGSKKETQKRKLPSEQKLNK
jgi:hypothetical protein